MFFETIFLEWFIFNYNIIRKINTEPKIELKRLLPENLGRMENFPFIIVVVVIQTVSKN